MSQTSLQEKGHKPTPVERHYDLSPTVWRPILGKDMNYHFGYFKDVDDRDYEKGLRATVAKLAAHIPKGSRVLDMGCGWGGPARQLMKEFGCKVQGITNSSVQAKYSQLRNPVKVLDVEKKEINGTFDVLWLLESFEHILDKKKLLKRIR